MELLLQINTQGSFLLNSQPAQQSGIRNTSRRQQCREPPLLRKERSAFCASQCARWVWRDHVELSAQRAQRARHGRAAQNAKRFEPDGAGCFKNPGGFFGRGAAGRRKTVDRWTEVGWAKTPAGIPNLRGFVDARQEATREITPQTPRERDDAFFELNTFISYKIRS